MPDKSERFNPITFDPKLKIWDRQPDEGADAFLAFCHYRDFASGTDRSLRKAWFSLHPEAKGMNGTWFNWSRQNRWLERVEAFDAEMAQQQREAQQRYREYEVVRLQRNVQVHRDNECYLAEQAFRKAQEILAIPLVRDSFVEQRDGTTIVHKATLITPAYYFAAAALMKAGSDLGRRGLGIKDSDDDEGMSPETFRRLFYRHTGEVARDLPAGALPAPVADNAVKPDIQTAANGDGSENGLSRFVPPRERP